MPGILPMKVIKIGSSSQQTRIAQACDRCRSKKIRCDGIRPCCSQCANVGFECKTSDKLSRRAFPRGYTESLEERVRQLEAEVRELKELLDEKDEKIDLLSRIHSYSTYGSQQNTPPRSNSTCLSPRAVPERRKSEAIIEKEDSFQVEAAPFYLGEDGNASFAMGSSSGRAFVDSFRRRVQQDGKLDVSFTAEAFFNHATTQYSLQASRGGSPCELETPPRVLSDQLVTIFFQEWAPLFPILHKPTFLTFYEQFVASDDLRLPQNDHVLAQLYLVFSIAALSGELRNQRDVDTLEQNINSFERGWRKSLDAVVMECSIETLQCLLLAQISCILRADYAKLSHYRSLAIGLSQRLGLHQSQKRFTLGALTCETRKKVFWSLYTLDCFSAAMLGLPKMLKEADVLAEYPADADDEYVTEKGFQATLPGESTKISSALALFRVSRILSKVLETNYPAAASYELSLQKLQALEDELDAWFKELAPHLKLQFVQDKPATNVINSRSPLLSLAYYYTRTLIHRPAILSNLGPSAASSIVALADSCKHIVQILELLEERCLSFSFCFNKNELLILSGFGLLFQGLDLNREGKLMKDNQKLLSSIVKMLERNGAPGTTELRKIAESLMPVSRSPTATIRKTSPDVHTSPPAIPHHPKSSHSRLSSLSSRFLGKGDPRLEEKTRRLTMPTAQAHNWVNSPSRAHHSFSSPRSEPGFRSHTSYHTPTQSLKHQLNSTSHGSLSVDYLPYGLDSVSEHPNRGVVTTTDEWERIVGSIDNGQANIYDNIYGGLSVDALINMSLSSAGPDSASWSPGIWGGVNELQPPMAQSVHSVSEESLTSGGDEMSSCELTNSHEDQYRGILIPNAMGHDGFCMDGLDGHFGL